MLSEKWRTIPIYRINNASFLRYLLYTVCTAEDVVEFYITTYKYVLDAFVSLRNRFLWTRFSFHIVPPFTGILILL